MSTLTIKGVDIQHLLLRTFNKLPKHNKHFVFLTKTIHISNTLVAVRNTNYKLGIVHLYDLHLMTEKGHHVGYMFHISQEYKLGATFLLTCRPQFYEQSLKTKIALGCAELKCRASMLRIFTFQDSAVLITSAEIPSLVTNFLN